MLFKETALRIAAEVCEYRKVGKKNKRSAWLDQKMQELVKDKIKL